MINNEYEVGKDTRLTSKRSTYIPDTVKNSKAIKKQKIVDEMSEGSQLSLLMEVVEELCLLSNHATPKALVLFDVISKIKSIRGK